MTHYLKRLAARKAAKEYMAGAKLRRDSEELADKSLAKKFGCSATTISKIRSGLPTGAVEAWFIPTIRECMAEKADIDKKLPTLTKEFLARKYQVGVDAVNIELDLLDYESPKARRKRKGAAA